MPEISFIGTGDCVKKFVASFLPASVVVLLAALSAARKRLCREKKYLPTLLHRSKS